MPLPDTFIVKLSDAKAAVASRMVLPRKSGTATIPAGTFLAAVSFCTAFFRDNGIVVFYQNEGSI